MLRKASDLAWVLFLATLAAGLPRRQSSEDPCARISSTLESFADRNETESAFVKPSLAYECLRSIPVATERDLALIKYLGPWLEFQSTIKLLPDPPQGYLVAGVDIFGGLQNISRNLQEGAYGSQYDFVIDIYRLINVKPRDGHLNYVPALLSLFNFTLAAEFVSISNDSLSIPKVYLYADYEQSLRQGYLASDVAALDSVPITEWLQQRAIDNAAYHDPDASYNAQLFSAALSNSHLTPWASQYVHTNLPDETSVEFSNGTIIGFSNKAFIVGNFSGIGSGSELHEQVEIPASDEPESPSWSPGFRPDLVGYPDPVVKHMDNFISGYFFNSLLLDQTAVLVVNQFISPNGDTGIPEDIDDTIRVLTEFVEASRASGKTRLILDLQGNGGGTIAHLVLIFLSLMPKQEFWMGMRARAHPALHWLGTSLEATGNSFTWPFSTETFRNAEFGNFTSFEQMFGPELMLGDSFTRTSHPSDVISEGNPYLQEQWFDPGNMVILTDGQCSSACAILVGLMSRHYGVATVALGGRPMETPMQAIGGTKGGPVSSLWEAQYTYSMLYDTDPPENVDITPFKESQAPIRGRAGYSECLVNMGNSHLKNDTFGIPVQFLYEAANCRLFYTWDTLTNMTRLWEAVADVRWNGGKCVPGSTVHENGTMGTLTPEWTSLVATNYTWAPGPGDVPRKFFAGESAAVSLRDGGSLITVIVVGTAVTLLAGII